MDSKEKSIEGIVAEGKGEGARFVSMQHYDQAFFDKLGFRAYPGTLNVKTKIPVSLDLKKLKSIRISGFKAKEKTYGGVDCYPAKISGINGAVIVPEFTGHGKEIIEFIAPVHLRTKLKLKNNDKVRIDLE